VSERANANRSAAGPKTEPKIVPNTVHRGLAARLMALALAQLALIAILAVGIAYLTRPPAPRDLSELVREVAGQLEGIEQDPRVLTHTLRALGARHGLDLSLYASDGSLRASTIEPPLPLHGPLGLAGGPPPREGPFADLGGPPHGFPRLAVDLSDGSHLAARPVRPALQYLGPLLTFLTGLLVLGIGGWLTARWIVRPLRTLRDAARSIASGNPRARAGLARNDEFGDVARAFDEMADHIEAARRSERELLANVSHELRTPLARLRVALEMAEEGHAGGKAALADAATDLGELESIIDSILSAVRMEREPGAPSGSFDYGLPARSLRDVAVDELLETSAARFRSRHGSRPLTLSLREPLPGVLVDPLLVRRVLENLLENAHKYSPEPLAPITLSARRLADASCVEIVVADQGMGIDAEDLPRVFEPFFRAERSRTRKEGGVGLGLTLGKRIVEAHGGSIAIESELRRGTTVRVRLPCRPPSEKTDTDGHGAAKSG
jgi:two-component system OmpR family sensor kinase